MIMIDCLQGSTEWHQARAGCITASMFGEVCNTLKNGDYSAKAKQYAFRLAIERISGTLLEEDKFETFEMRRGRELEPKARLRHEQEIGEMVEQVGFIKTDDGLFGASLDGLVGADGSSEYKCFMAPSSLMPIILENDISGCIHQVQGVIWLSGRKWNDFCLYCPALESIGKDFIRFRTMRDDNFIEEMEVKLLKFNQLVNEYEAKLRG